MVASGAIILDAVEFIFVRDILKFFMSEGHAWA